MNVGELIDALSKYPRELPVLMGSGVPRYVDRLPGYYDGSYFTIENKDGKDVMVFDTTGDKIIINGIDLEDFIWKTTEEVEFTDNAPMSWDELISRIDIRSVSKLSGKSIIERSQKHFDKATEAYFSIVFNMEQELIKGSKEYIERTDKIYPSEGDVEKPLTAYMEYVLKWSLRFQKEGEKWTYCGQ